jgi:glycosyltransferase involved in cell wall biosynthesis
VFQRLKGLSDLGYEVDLLTYHVGQNVDLPGLNILRGPHVSFIKQVKIGPSLPKLFLDVLLIWKAYQMLQSIKYDLIHTHEEAAFMGVLFSKLYNIPHLYDMHSSLPSQLKNFRFGNFWPILPLFRWLERLVLNTCDGLITIGADLEAYASTLNPSIKQVHIENLAIYEDGTSPKPFTVDEIKFSLGLNDKRLIVYTGTFERYQGLDLFLDSVNPILDRNPGLAVVMVGGKPDQVEVYRQQAAQLGISRQMIFTGIIPPAEAMVYLEMADYLVSPRTEGLSVPLKIYSYLYAGKPILATDIYAHTQVLDETVALIVPPHRQGLMDGLQRLIDDEALCKRIGYQAKRFAEKRFNPEQYTAKIDIIYRKILPFKDATETVLPSKTAVSEKIGQSYRSEIVR